MKEPEWLESHVAFSGPGAVEGGRPASGPALGSSVENERVFSCPRCESEDESGDGGLGPEPARTGQETSFL